MKKILIFSFLVSISIILVGLTSAKALTLGFECITNNKATDAAIGEAQLFVVITAQESDQVLFTFENTGPAPSFIAQIYFDDGTLLGIASIINGPGVSFSQGATPPNLPGGENLSPPFNVTAGFLADAKNPSPQYGVNTGEWVGILFNLLPGMDFSDVVDALNSGELRIGIHVQGFASEGSESFVNRVPEPSTVLLLGVGLVGLGLINRKRRIKGS